MHHLEKQNMKAFSFHSSKFEQKIKLFQADAWKLFLLWKVLG